jgi:hypothetical protein
MTIVTGIAISLGETQTLEASSLTRLAALGLCHEANTFTARRLDAGEGTPPAC